MVSMSVQEYCFVPPPRPRSPGFRHASDRLKTWVILRSTCLSTADAAGSLFSPRAVCGVKRPRLPRFQTSILSLVSGGHCGPGVPVTPNQLPSLVLIVLLRQRRTPHESFVPGKILLVFAPGNRNIEHWLNLLEEKPHSE